MSFTKTISTVAALASIFGAGAAGFKLAQDSQSVDNQNTQTKYEERITELQQQVSNLQQQTKNVNPPTPVTLPQATPEKQVPPATPILPATTTAAVPAAAVPSTPPAPQPPTP